MRPTGEAATDLPWLSPCATSLLALARGPTAAAWEQVRFDPGAVLLVCRHQPAAAASFSLAALRDPALLDTALRLLPSDASDPATGSTDWAGPAVQPVYRTCVTLARLAARILELAGRGDPDAAWCAGLLTPLGWLAVSAIAPAQVAACLADPRFASQPVRTQQRHWGLDHGAIARRLLRQWQLPGWLAASTTHLDLPADTALSLGADPELFRALQLAVGLAAEQQHVLHLAVAAPPSEAAAALGLEAEALEALRHEAARRSDPPTRSWASPQSMPLLRDLLVVAAENLRLRDAPTVGQLEEGFDRLHQALAGHHAAEAERLQAQKLSALAEFAGGAGHEINNPLAVISGQAQYLLGHEEDPARQKALQKIIGQAQRIHQVLTELMQFARPPRPQRQLIDVPDLLRSVAAAVADLAGQRGVRLDVLEPPGPVTLYADLGQLRTALVCLLRNAVEASPPEGWARIRVEAPMPERVEFLVEDNGSGPTVAQREHLFDPFYSGRPAGRGRGLGLPTAWRLARQHGGDVRFEPLATGPTRFVLSLPHDDPSPSPARAAA